MTAARPSYGSGLLGLGSFALAWAIGVPGSMPAEPLGLTGFLDRARALGAGVVQLGDNLPLDHLPDPELDRLLQLARSSAMVLEVGTRGSSTDHLRDYLRVARRLESRLLRVVLDRGSDEPEPRDVVRRLQPLLPELEHSGVVLGIENHDRLPAGVLAGIVRELDSPYLGVCLDTVNSLGVLEGPGQVLEDLGPYTVSLHVKDFRIDRVHHNMGFNVTGTPAGQGMLDIPGTLARLGQLGRTPNLILELWPPPEADIQATVAKEWEWAQASMAYLRQIVAAPA